MSRGNVHLYLRICPLICNPRRFVTDVNNAALNEALLFDRSLHYLIIGVGVDPNTRRDALAKVCGAFENAVGTDVARYSVDSHIHIIIQPSSALNITVRRVFAIKKRENTVNAKVIENDTTPLAFYVVDYHLMRWINTSPLMRIACLDHKLSRVPIYLRYPLKIGHRRFSDM